MGTTTTAKEQTPRQIEFDDIRGGDRIEVAWSVGDREEAYRGVAAYTSAHGTWCTEEGMPIATQAPGEIITLLHRPTVTEPTGLGAVVRHYGCSEYVSTNSEPGELRWVIDVPRAAGEDALLHRWSEFNPDSIEVLSEGIEADQ